MLASLVAGCSTGSPEVVTVTVTAPAEQSADETRPMDLRDGTTFVERELAPSRSGHLAYVGRDDNVYVVDPRSGETVQVTDDRSSAGTKLGIFHTGMAWSHTGELAFARTDVESFTSSLFVTTPGSGRATRLTRERGILIYASWSPARCAALTCSKLATITDVDRRPGGKVALNVLAFPTRSTARSVLEKRGAQVYFSWAAGGRRLVRHVLGREIARGGGRLEEVDVEAGTSRALRGAFAPFLAPAVADGRVVYAVADSSESKPTVRLTRSAVIVHAPRGVRRVVFAPSPDGRRLAFAVRGRSQLTPDQAFEEPWIADLETGETQAAGPLTLWTKAFYWAPDSRRLAYLTHLDSVYRPYNQWRIFDAEAGVDSGSASFQPTTTFDTLTMFFDQFGQSHSFWSPDGRYLTYAAVSDAGQDEVWMLDTREGERTLVADGVVGVFSWR